MIIITKQDGYNLLRKVYTKTGKCPPKSYTETSDWINCLCPYHQENKPSFGINWRKGVYKCFSCNSTGTLEGLAWDFNIDFSEVSFESTREEIINVNHDLIFENIRNSEETFTIDQFKWLQNNGSISKLLIERKITHQTMIKYGITSLNGVIQFPVFDQYGDPVFIAKRSEYNKQFYIQKGVDLPLYLGWDIESWYGPVNPRRTELWVSEGPIDALSLREMGKLSVALFGLGSRNQIELLKNIPQRSIVLALDFDGPGYKASEKLFNELKNYKKVYMIDKLDNTKDPNDILVNYGRDKELKFTNCEDIFLKSSQSASESYKRRPFIHISST